MSRQREGRIRGAMGSLCVVMRGPRAKPNMTGYHLRVASCDGWLKQPPSQTAHHRWQL